MTDDERAIYVCSSWFNVDSQSRVIDSCYRFDRFGNLLESYPPIPIWGYYHFGKSVSDSCFAAINGFGSYEYSCFGDSVAQVVLDHIQVANEYFGVDNFRITANWVSEQLGPDFVASVANIERFSGSAFTESLPPVQAFYRYDLHGNLEGIALFNDNDSTNYPGRWLESYARPRAAVYDDGTVFNAAIDVADSTLHLGEARGDFSIAWERVVKLDAVHEVVAVGRGPADSNFHRLILRRYNFDPARPAELTYTHALYRVSRGGTSATEELPAAPTARAQPAPRLVASPNPARGWVQLADKAGAPIANSGGSNPGDANAVRVRVLDSGGAPVRLLVYDSDAGGVNLSDLPAGTYHLIATTRNVVLGVATVVRVQ